jgi:hypothetical protein
LLNFLFKCLQFCPIGKGFTVQAVSHSVGYLLRHIYENFLENLIYVDVLTCTLKWKEKNFWKGTTAAWILLIIKWNQGKIEIPCNFFYYLKINWQTPRVLKENMWLVFEKYFGQWWTNKNEFSGFSKQLQAKLLKKSFWVQNTYNKWTKKVFLFGNLY